MAKAKTAKVKKDHKFVLVEADYWEALYVDGKLIDQMHTVELVDYLRKFGVNIRTKYAYNDPQVLHEGTLPDDLTDVKFDRG
jgi:lipopolysaccharide export system protein LptC